MKWLKANDDLIKGQQQRIRQLESGLRDRPVRVEEALIKVRRLVELAAHNLPDLRRDGVVTSEEAAALARVLGDGMEQKLGLASRLGEHQQRFDEMRRIRDEIVELSRKITKEVVTS